jgi:hypothetical protein
MCFIFTVAFVSFVVLFSSFFDPIKQIFKLFSSSCLQGQSHTVGADALVNLITGVHPHAPFTDWAYMSATGVSVQLTV